MAKTIFSGDSNKFSDVSNFVGQFLSDGAISMIDQPDIEFIPSGSYVLSACMSGSLLGGVPSGHCVMISGDPKTGKSYIVLDIIRFCQLMGYYPIIFDSEHAHSKERYVGQGIDPENCRIIVPETINEITSPMVQLTQSLMDTALKYAVENKKLPKDQQKEVPKIAVFVDSVTSLNSSKQLNDALEGEMKTDMGTVAKELKVMYNLLIPRFGKLNIPMVCTAHTYEKDEGHVKVKTISGGRGSMYMPSVVINLRKTFDKDEDKQKQGIIVTAEIMESRFSMHRPVKFYISFTKGINRFLGLEDFISWDVCGITKGKMVDYISTAQELVAKKLVTVENLLSMKFSTKQLSSQLSKSKEELFQPSFEDDLEKGYIEFDCNTEQQIQLPNLIGFLEDNKHNVNLEFDTIFLKEKMQLSDIYSEQAFVKWIQNSITNDDIFVMGNGKVDINKNQKFKFKKPVLDLVNNNKYEYNEYMFIHEGSSSDIKFNPKLDQKFKFTEKFITEKIKDGCIIKEDRKVCKPQSTSNQYCVKHLNRCVNFEQLFNKTVFNDDILKTIDEKIIKPLFQYRTEYIESENNLEDDDKATTAVNEFENQMSNILGQ